jgi:DNA-binding NtrC family response regulator
LLVDKIGAASPLMQSRLLQAIEDKWVQRVGDERPPPVDVRWVFATNVDLWKAVLKGRLREDLYFRTSALAIRMPALVDRREDIPELLIHLLSQRCAEAGVKVQPLSPEQVKLPMAHNWPGNVRELNNCIIHYIVYGLCHRWFALTVGLAGRRYWRTP